MDLPSGIRRVAANARQHKVEKRRILGELVRKNVRPSTPVVKRIVRKPGAAYIYSTSGGRTDALHENELLQDEKETTVLVDGIPYSLQEVVYELKGLNRKIDKGRRDHVDMDHYRDLNNAKAAFLCASPSVFLK